jgi:tetratricopeptide (TPR) repeat protein
MFTFMMGHGSEHITEKEEKLIFEASKVSSIYNTEIEMISNMCILNNIIGDYSSAINWGLIQVKYWEDLSRRLPYSDKWSQEALVSSMYTLGISYFRNGDYEKSKQTLIESLEHSSNNETRANIHFFLARAYRKLGEYDIALVHIQKYDNENDPMYFRIYAQILIDLGQKEKAKNYLEVGCRLNDNWACTKLKFL